MSNMSRVTKNIAWFLLGVSVPAVFAFAAANDNGLHSYSKSERPASKTVSK